MMPNVTGANTPMFVISNMIIMQIAIQMISTKCVYAHTIAL
jgi:hypothetical protein